MPKKAQIVSSLSASATAIADRRSRHFIPLPHRLVMVADRFGDGARLPLRFGEIAADHALKLRELADHAGDEVRLGEPRRALDLVRLGLDDAAFDQPSRELCDALDLVGDRAELLVEDDLVELLRLLFERNLEVLLPEEARVSEPRGKHSRDCPRRSPRRRRSRRRWRRRRMPAREAPVGACRRNISGSCAW